MNQRKTKKKRKRRINRYAKRGTHNQNCFIPATEDWCGKELFSIKEVRESFLSDILKIPRDSIKDTEIINSSLWKRRKKDKQGIVDVRIRLNNDRIINIEIQVMHYDHWDKRQLFYLSKMYAENARRGEDYDNLPECISIAILDFNLTDEEEYYHCYKLRDENGRVFSNGISIYILELEKTLGKEKELDDWVRLFRAKSEEDLNMITTKNRGILEAIKELKTIGLSNILREEYEFRLKVKRDAHARESYVRKQGIAIGKEEGIAIGKAEGKAEEILAFLAELGVVSEELKEHILTQKDLDMLSQWLKLAAKAKSIQEFQKNIG